MVPGREIFWNIQFGAVIYILAAIATGILVYAIYRYYRRWRVGDPANRFNHPGKRVWSFIVIGVVDGLLHRKIFGADDGQGRVKLAKDWKPREFYPGLAHFLIFIGCIVFLLGSLLDFISHYFFDFMHGGVYLGYSVVLDSFGILAIVGVVLAMNRRYVQKPDRLDNKRDDLVALLLILVIIATGFIVEGLRIAATELKTAPGWAPWSPVGYVLALAFSGVNQGALLTAHVVTWWFHSLLTLGAIVYVSLFDSRLFHIIWSPINVFFRELGPRGALAAIDLDTAESFGASKVEQFTWKQLLDLDACTRCGRCQDACPAHSSGKALNPKKVILDLKGHLHEMHPVPLERKPNGSSKDMITDVITQDVIWDCTTCGACQQACPVYIEHVNKIIDMRRSLVLERVNIPEPAEGALRSIEDIGHPWRGTTVSREYWAQGMGVNILSAGANVEILYWVGCTSALEDRSMRVAQAVAKLLKAAGVNFGILGDEESCCGEPARRLGNEYLFQVQAKNNIELMKRYGVKKIVTSCPHCYNTIKNEYPQFGGAFEVIHHTQFLAGLMVEQRLKIAGSGKAIVSYHDPCYLGRYNDIYEPPRQILNNMPGITVVEMAQHRGQSFCCGGGGGHMWLEERTGKKICEMRVEQAVDVKPQVIATACPYCLQMLELGAAGKSIEGMLKVMDIAEIAADRL